MSAEDAKRYSLLQQTIEGKLTLREVTEALGLSYRQALRLRAKVAATSPAGLLHGNRGRSPANKLPEELHDQVVALAKGRYAHCNDTHFQELLAAEQGIVLSRETLRRWRREAGLAPKQRRRAPKHRKRRPRAAAEGLLLLWDGSPHPWFGADHPACCLMAAIDDATGQVLAAHFCPAETSWAYLQLLDLVLQSWGVPASIYQDRHGTLKRNDAFWSHEEALAGRQHPTQVGAALEALGIQPIFAKSPQAKGRIERLFRTLQDRLLAELELAEITTQAEANRFLNGGFLDAHNTRFAQAPAQSASVWRPAPPRAQRERILSLCYPATVGNDNAVRLEGLLFDIPPGPGKRSYARERVEVRQLLDGRGRIYHRERVLAEAPATEIAEPIRARRRRLGTRGAHDDAWVYAASKPSAPERERLEELSTGRPPAGLRRAGPGGVIGGTRLG